MGRRVYIDKFSTSLDELPRKAKSDLGIVFDTIIANGRFSAFEIDASLAGTVQFLFARGYLKRLPESAYPWTLCEATAKGTEWRRPKEPVALSPPPNQQGET